MIVVIPHPEQETLIKKTQKELCDILNSSSVHEYNNKQFFFPTFPLWFPLENSIFFEQTDEENLSKEKLKKFSNTISEIKIKSELKEKHLYIIFELFIAENIYKTKIPFFTNQNELTEIEISKIMQYFKNNSLPEKLKIFRLGKKIQLTEHSQALEYFVWKKVK